MTFMFRVFVTIEKEGEEESEVEVARVTGNVRLGPGWTSSRPQSRLPRRGVAEPVRCAGSGSRSRPSGTGEAQRGGGFLLAVALAPPRLGGRAHTAGCGAAAGG